MRLLWRLLGWFTAIALVVYFAVVALRVLDLSRVVEVVSSPAVAVSMLTAIALYALIVPISAWAWKCLLRARGEAWGLGDLTIILGVSQLAKYVPGNVLQHMARAAGSIQSGMKLRSFLATVAQETALATSASLLVGTLALVVSGRSLADLHYKGVQSVLLVGAILATTVLVVSCWRIDPNRPGPYQSLFGKMLLKIGGTPGPKASLFAFSAYSFNYLIVGAGLWLVSHSLGVSMSLGYWAVTAVFSLSWVLGFLTPGAPAGIGTREGIMLLLMRDAASEDALVTFVLLARVITVFGDLACFVIAALLLRWKDNAGGGNG